MVINSSSNGIVIAQIRVFQDGGYEFTGNTFVLNCGPDGWDPTGWMSWFLDTAIEIADENFGDWEGFQVMGYFNTIYVK